MLRYCSKAMENPVKRVPIPKNGVDYRGKIVLAPMVRSGELPSRLLALKYGADLVWGPETIDRSMIGTTRKVNLDTSTIDFTRLPSNSSRPQPEVQKESLIFSTHPVLEHRRLIFQLGTASPSTAVEAATLVARDVAGIDVNAGCPKSFSTAGGMGAALLQDPQRLHSILSALVREVGQVYEIGISVKIRLLDTLDRTASLVRMLCTTGITGLTIHCRTTPMRPRERAIRQQLQTISKICREAGVACLMNGDVANKDEALQLMEQYQVDGAMIATAAEANSSCFRKGDEGGLLPWKEVVTAYVTSALEVGNRWGNTKFLLSQLIPGKSEIFQRVVSCNSYQDVCRALDLSHLDALARSVDEKLGNGNRLTKAMKKKMRRQEIAEAAATEFGTNQDQVPKYANLGRWNQTSIRPVEFASNLG